MSENGKNINDLNWKAKVIQADALLDKLRPGQKIFVTSGVATPGKTLAAIAHS